MEAFSFLKYWRTTRDSETSQPTSTTDDDDGPFFDLEFAEEDDQGNKEEQQNGVVSSSSDDEDDDEEREFNLTLSSGSSNNNVNLSPSDELFFKGRLVPVLSGSESDSKPQFSLLKSATKLRVFINKLKPPKQQLKQEINPRENASQQQSPATSNSKLFTIKFKVEEVPMLSLFTRDNSKNTKTSSFQKQSANASSVDNFSSEDPVSQSVMNKYLKKVKPLYIRVSKMKFSTAAEVDVKTGQKQGSFPGGFRVVSKHLGKSRSASSAVVAAAPMPVSKRRDDSLLQQQDGIQSAILHCKRSFNASTDSESLLLSRSVSDPSHEKSMEFSWKKQGEAKDLRVTEGNPKKAGNVA